jgi:tetratricopeptide (TPR) repeat protein
MPGKVALAIDIDGDDVYNRGTRRYGQGFGCLSVGMMVDISGNDKYVAGNMAQGSGMYGIGVLADLQGQDSYRMGLMGQGFGLFGIGLLLDADGKDRYVVNGMGQGTGSTMGIGSLVDVKGNDKYLAERKKRRGMLVADNWSHAQGSGLSIRYPEWEKHFSYYGGIGFLSDGSGDDFYFSTGGNCMGSSYFMSIGALVDHGGNDRYMPRNGHGLGFAVHFSHGILIDRKGNDTYYGNIRTGGVGSDRSVAVLADYAGDDTYGPSEEYVKGSIGSIEDPDGESQKNKDQIYRKMAQSSYASALKPKALGILIDYSGTDRYFASPAEKGESFGGVTPPVAPHNWSHAMLFDLGGNDFYYKEGRKNNHYFNYLDHGLCYDTEYPDAAGLGKKNLPVPKRRSMTAEKTRALSKSRVIIDDLADLTNIDLFVRYIAIGKVIQKGAASIPDLIDLLSISDDEEFNRDLIEILDTLTIIGELKQSHSKQLETLLYAADPFVRIFAARTLADRNIKGSLPALILAVSEKNDSVRFHIIRALGRADSPRAVEVLIDLAATDPSAQCRRAAVRSLGELAEKKSTGDSAANAKLRASLLKALAAADEAVRTYAAIGLRYYGKDTVVANTLRERTRDDSVYVRRMAAKSLILNGAKEGIPVLIESLKFRSIDTFEYYDHDIAKDLAFYTGIDFPGDQRYAYSTWHKWWQDAGGSVNLKQNLDIMRSIEEAFAAPSEEHGITIFERLMQEYPDNVVVRRRYLRYGDEWINFRLLTRRKITPEIFERCLRLQKITTKLEPESAQRWDRLAYYYARLSRYVDAAAALESAIALEPGNKAFKKALRQYRRQIKEES